MGLCSRPGEDSNAWKQFGPEPIRAIEPQHRPPGQRWVLGVGIRVGGSSIDMYNNDVGKESAQKFMKQTGDLKAATLYFAS